MTHVYPEPVADLLRAVDDVIEPWLLRVMTAAATAGLESLPPDFAARAARAAADARSEAMDRLHLLAATDVESQRTNPLAILRSAVRHATEVLTDADVPPVTRDEFSQRSFPEDVYGLAPATGSDVDPALHDVGIAWGAWKAVTIMQRHRRNGEHDGDEAEE
jgi:hypothetical protein